MQKNGGYPKHCLVLNAGQNHPQKLINSSPGPRQHGACIIIPSIGAYLDLYVSTCPSRTLAPETSFSPSFPNLSLFPAPPITFMHPPHQE